MHLHGRVCPEVVSCRGGGVVHRIHLAQQGDFLGASRRGGAPHPHPAPPVDLAAASSAQHALTPAGAGPPQQPLAEPVCVREFSAFAFVPLLVSMLIFPQKRAACPPLMEEDGGSPRWTQHSLPPRPASLPTMSRLYRQRRDLRRSPWQRL